MRSLPVLLAVLLASTPVMKAYGEAMAGAHCRTHGHLSSPASQPARDSSHAQHQAQAAGTHQHDAAGGGGLAKTDDSRCQCGCLCDAVCTGGAALTASVDVPGAAPLHEPWQAVTDIRHPVSVHDSLLRPPRLS